MKTKKQNTNREVKIKYNLDISDFKAKMLIVRKELRMLKKELRGIKIS